MIESSPISVRNPKILKITMNNMLPLQRTIKVGGRVFFFKQIH